MKKQMISMALAGLMVAGLAGCGGGASPSTDSSGAQSQAQSSQGAEAATGDNTLTVWCWDPAFNIYSMKEAEKFYQKDHPDFKLNVVETPWNDVQTKVITAATSGDLSTLPDILLMQDNAFQKNTISYPDAFLDLEGSGIVFEDFAKAKTAYSVVDGKHYGVPFDNGAAIAAYRTDLLEEAGLTVDDFKDITWDEYIEKGKVVLEKTGKPLLSCMSGESDVIMMMIQSAGGSLFDAEGKPDIAGNAIVKEAMETYKKIKDAGVLVEVNDWDQYVSSLTGSNVAGTIQGCWIIGSIRTAEDQSGKWAITNIPRFANIDTATNYSNNGGSSWLITSNTKNKELAMDFLKSTFGSNVPFYEDILPQSGALSTYIPAGQSDIYSQPQEFFGGQAIYKDITEFDAKVPSNNTGVYYYEARDAISVANQKVLQGSPVDAELQVAQDTVEFAMTE